VFLNHSKMSARLTEEGPVILVASRNRISTEWINKQLYYVADYFY